MCPYCSRIDLQIKKGFYTRPSDHKKLQRYLCKPCSRLYSEQRFGIEFRLRLRSINQTVFNLLCSGMSQRRCAALCETRPRAIALRLDRFGTICKDNLEIYRLSRPKATIIHFDEMESKEQSKLKPLTIPIAVEERTRKILALKVGDIATKGTLAKVAESLGMTKRECERKSSIEAVFEDLRQCVGEQLIVKSDESTHYVSLVKRFFPNAIHKTYKGRKEKPNGLGELKTGGFDPLFWVNHTFAMLRDNLKRLSRKTWAITKKKAKLELHLFLYAWFHNLWVERKDKPIQLLKLNGFN